MLPTVKFNLGGAKGRVGIVRYTVFFTEKYLYGKFGVCANSRYTRPSSRREGLGLAQTRI